MFQFSRNTNVQYMYTMPRRISMFDINKFCTNNKCRSNNLHIKNETEGNTQCHIFYGTATMSKAMRYSQYIRTSKPCIYRNVNNEAEIAYQTLVTFIYGNVDVVNSLLNSIVDINAYDKNNWNALSRAANDNDLNKAVILLNAGANVNSRDEFGWTPLYWARQQNNAEMINLLLNAGSLDDAGLV